MISTSLTAGVAFALLMAGLVPLGSRLMAPVAAEAQNLGQRAVMGAVVDANSTPVAGATVFLRDLKSKNIRSFTSVEHGRFRFAALFNFFDLYRIADLQLIKGDDPCRGV